MTAREQFEALEEKFDMKFEDIPEAERLHPLKDVCAMLYLHRKFGGTFNAIAAAEHDIVYLEGDVDELTADDALYLHRCGVFIDSDSDSLAIFA